MGEEVTIYQAMAAVAGEIGAVAKNLRNKEAGYSARSIDDVLNAVHGPLTKHGVVLAPEVLEANYETVPVGQKQTMMRQATLRIRYRFYGPAGDFIDVVACGEALDSGDKATNKAATAALKYALLQTFTIPLVGDDADTQTPERAAPVKSRKVPASPAPGNQVIDSLTEKVRLLPEAQRIAFAEWKQRQAFIWPWSEQDIVAMNAKLDDLEVI